MILRAIAALKLLGRIRQDRPDLWQQIVAFAEGVDKFTLLMDEAERDYRDLFEGNLPRSTR
jgi:hypothetical protein